MYRADAAQNRGIHHRPAALTVAAQRPEGKTAMAPLWLLLRIAQEPYSHQAPVEPAPQAQSVRGGGSFIFSRPYEALPLLNYRQSSTW